MPFISVVVPGGGSTDCLDSILDQSDADTEVIVAGAAPAHLLIDPRVRLVPAPVGPGPEPAWAAGLEASRGEYAWLVHPSGRLAAGALAAVAHRLRRLQPDLLLIGHEGRPGPPAQPPPAAGVFTVAQRPDAFASAPDVWARVVRVELVARAGFRFHDGRYADVVFTYPVLVAAERIAVLDQICYHHREEAPAGDEAEFDVFGQYERLFALLDQSGVDGREARDHGHVRARIAERMMDHYWWLLTESGRVPPTLQRGFFARMSEHQQRYLPPSPRPGRGLDDLHRGLVGRDRWRAYVALRSVRQFTRTAGERIRQAVAPNGR